ncbi:MAG TPA: DUF488 family protein [Planctomycetaceae bacterium]|nr:DUF488 family protein [Planctomycetaceae bacterium]
MYDEKSPEDGLRVLVDRLWPRGLSKQKAGVDLWLKEIAPSHELRKWFGHDPAKWKDFQVRYRKEIADQAESLALLKKKCQEGTVTLLFAAHDEEHNNAIVLENVLRHRGK